MEADSIQFTVYGKPSGKREARTRWVRTKDGRAYPQHYQPTEVEMWQLEVKQEAVKVAPAEFWKEGPVSLLVIVLRTRPRHLTRKKLPSDARPATSPDADRLATAICDALQEVVYRNDGQISRLMVEKLYVEGRPSITVIARRLDAKTHDAVSRRALQLAEADAPSESDDQADIFAAAMEG